MTRTVLVFVVLATIACVVMLAGCHAKQTSPRPTTGSPPAPAPATRPTPAAPSQERTEPHAPSAEENASVRSGVNGLAVDLFARLASSAGNVVFSPASIEAALAMTAAGARGETATEMARVLHLGPDERSALDALGGALRRWDDPARVDGTLRVANRLFGDRHYSFERAYLDYVSRVYEAPLEPLDFRGAFEPSRVHINDWVVAHTAQRIQNLLPSGSVTADTRLVLVNAVYLDAKWETPFEKDATRPSPFHTASGVTVDVPTMHRRGTFGHAVVDGADVVELRYRGGDLAMRFILPPRGTTPAAWATREHLVEPTEVAPAQLFLALPKFRLEPGEPVRLRSHLDALGMHTAFDRHLANFTGIADPPNPDDRLVISEAFHKAFVRVDEEGTEAAAATAVVMMRAGAAPAPVREISFDRPFLFVLSDVRSGAILFLGRVDDPR